MEKNILFERQEPALREKKVGPQVAQTVGSFGKAIQLRWPTDYVVITQPFGANLELFQNRGFPGHEGLDIRAPLDSKVYACADGTVETVNLRPDDDNPYGRYATILHGDGYRTLYGHLSTIAVAKGQKVKAGTVIGNAGPTGQTSGGHIHLSLTQQGATAKGLTHFLDDIVDPTPFLSFSAKRRDFSVYPWPLGRCLRGAHLSDDGSGMNASANIAAEAEAVMLGKNTSKERISDLRKSNPTLFMMTQLGLPTTRKVVAANEWVGWVQSTVQQHVEAGVGYFVVHRAPNLASEGYGLHWGSGKEFGRWWMDAVSLLKARFPMTRFGFPGLAPGLQITGQRLDGAAFMEGADEAILHADWIGAICNWDNPKEMMDEDKGVHYLTLRRYYPDQLIFITEFGSVNTSLDANSRMSEDNRYFEIVKNEAGIGAAFGRVQVVT